MFNFINESELHENSRRLKMELAKISAILTGFINVFLYVSAWFANLDNTKSTILFIVALAMSLYRFYRWAISSIQNKELKDILKDREALENEKMRIDIEILRHSISKTKLN